MSVDGFVATPNGDIGRFRQVEGFGETLPDQLARFISIDAMILGAHTYELLAQQYAGAEPDDDFAQAVNRLPKHVFSRRLAMATWGTHQPARLERGEVSDVVPKIRDSYAGDVVVWGSLDITAELFEYGLVDELRLCVVPVLLGEGRRMMRGPECRARLLTCVQYPKGHVTLSYRIL